MSAPGLRDIPLLVLTAHDSPETMLDALGEGADDFVAKSADVELLRARVRAQLRRKQFEEETRRIREDLLRSELRVAEEHAARQLAEARALLTDELERKNRKLAAITDVASAERREAEAASRAKSDFLSAKP